MEMNKAWDSVTALKYGYFHSKWPSYDTGFLARRNPTYASSCRAKVNVDYSNDHRVTYSFVEVYPLEI